MTVIRGRLTPEEGAVLMQALAAACETLYQRARGADAASDPEDVSSETPSMAQQQADALVLPPPNASEDRQWVGGRAGRADQA